MSEDDAMKLIDLSGNGHDAVQSDPLKSPTVESLPPRCDRCVSWDRDNEQQQQFAGIANIRACTQAPMFWHATEWSVYEGGESDDWEPKRTMKPEYSNTRIFVQDGSDYRAWLLTRADFYCASFVPFQGVRHDED